MNIITENCMQPLCDVCRLRPANRVIVVHNDKATRNQATKTRLTPSPLPHFQHATTIDVILGSLRITDPRGFKPPPSADWDDPWTTDHLPHKPPPPLPSKMIRDFPDHPSRHVDSLGGYRKGLSEEEE